jgi:hypothetical protein
MTPVECVHRLHQLFGGTAGDWLGGVIGKIHADLENLFFAEHGRGRRTRSPHRRTRVRTNAAFGHGEGARDERETENYFKAALERKHGAGKFARKFPLSTI